MEVKVGASRSVGRIEHPQEIECSCLFFGWRALVECGQNAFSEATVRVRIDSALRPARWLADFTHQCRRLPDHTELAPLAFAGEIVIHRQLVTADGRHPSAQHSRWVGHRVEGCGSARRPRAAAILLERTWLAKIGTGHRGSSSCGRYR